MIIKTSLWKGTMSTLMRKRALKDTPTEVRQNGEKQKLNGKPVHTYRAAHELDSELAIRELNVVSSRLVEMDSEPVLYSPFELEQTSEDAHLSCYLNTDYRKIGKEKG